MKDEPASYADKMIEALGEISTPSTAAMKILSMLSDPGTSPKRVAEIISADYSFSAKVLKICNSAYYGRPREIKRLEQGVLMLGFHEIKNLIYTLLAFDYINNIEFEEIHAELRDHFRSVAVTARILADYRPEVDNDVLYISGLLHDIGKVILVVSSPHEYGNYLLHSDKASDQILDKEMGLFGCDHQIIGERLLDRWKIPKEISSVAGSHHALSLPENDTISPGEIVEIANNIVYSIQSGSEIVSNSQEKFERLLDGASFEDIFDQCRIEIENSNIF